MTNLADAAYIWYTAGWGPMPTMPGEKRPHGLWRQYQSEPAPLATVTPMLGGRTSLGLVLLPGQEAIDVEGRAVADGTWRKAVEAANATGLGDLLARVMAGYHETTPSGGIHLLWRCETVEGNQKLASRPHPQECQCRICAAPNEARGEDALIETRGPGGFIVVAPSTGYARQQGAPDKVATLTSEEREHLLTLFRALDERAHHHEQRSDQFDPPGRGETGARPGDAFTASTTWEELLEPAGWVKVRVGSRGETWWRRPGKDRGWSATTNATGNDTLHVHSTSTEFTPSPRSYSRFGAYAVLHHHGDHEAAARELAARGYGDQPRTGEGGAANSRPRSEPHTDLGNARRLVDEHGQRLRHVMAWNRWYAWDGMRWVPDETGEVFRCAKQLADTLLQEARAEPDEEKRKKLVQSAKRAQSMAGIKGMVTLAATEPQIAVAAHEFDAHPTLLNTRTGVLDLESGELRPHDPKLNLTKVTTAGFVPGATAPEFARFLERVQPDPEMRRFLARLLGHTLPGQITEHLMTIFHGGGANGKSTLTELVRKVLGGYAATTDPGLLIDRGESHPTGIADLFGIRLALTHETDSGRKLAEGTIKRLTGGDRIKARRMREDFWEFDPTHSIVMVTNHQPIVSGDDEGIWRRLRMVPWDVVIPSGERDPKLPERLELEADGVLTWLVEGYWEYRSRGLDEPGAVQEATAAYRAESDALGRFIDERCLIAGGFRTRSSELFAAWSEWCRREGLVPGTQTMFSRSLSERGYDRTKSDGRMVWLGIGLATEDDEDEKQGGF